MQPNRLKQVLEQEGITQVELSQAAGISIGTINKVSRQKATPAPRTLARIVNGVNRIAFNHYDRNDIFPEKEE